MNGKQVVFQKDRNLGILVKRKKQIRHWPVSPNGKNKMRGPKERQKRQTKDLKILDKKQAKPIKSYIGLA
jgi:hypothetical protein